MKLKHLVYACLVASTVVWAAPPKTGNYTSTTTVEVEAHGKTFEDAKNNAFRKAIERVVGSVVLSNLESSNGQITKDQIASYSAGYVDNYEVLDQYPDPEFGHTVQMSVTVASSRLAQRMLESGNKNLMVDGQRLQAKLETQLEERRRGDYMISTVLASYPENAFLVNGGQVESRITQYRGSQVEVPFEISMNQEWLAALGEAVGLISVDSTSCTTLTMVVAGGLKSPRNSDRVNRLAEAPCGNSPDIRIFYKKSGDFFAKAYSYKFRDLNTLAMINNQIKPKLGQQRIGLQVDLLDAGGMTLDSKCSDVNTELFIKHNEPNLPIVSSREERMYSRPDIVGQNKLNGVLNINVSNLNQIGEVSRVRLSVQASCR